MGDCLKTCQPAQKERVVRARTKPPLRTKPHARTTARAHQTPGGQSARAKVCSARGAGHCGDRPHRSPLFVMLGLRALALLFTGTLRIGPVPSTVHPNGWAFGEPQRFQQPSTWSRRCSRPRAIGVRPGRIGRRTARRSGRKSARLRTI